MKKILLAFAIIAGMCIVSYGIAFAISSRMELNVREGDKALIELYRDATHSDVANSDNNTEDTVLDVSADASADADTVADTQQGSNNSEIDTSEQGTSTENETSVVYDTTSTASSTSTTSTSEYSTERSTTVTEASGEEKAYKETGIDSILHMPTLGVSLPVLKGNTIKDLDAFRTVLSNDSMVLGSTRYGIMGHHAINMNVSLGGIDKLKIGDVIQIEQGSKLYDFKVVSSVAKYAKECSYLFSAEKGVEVYLFTCDYSLKGNETAYRVVKCEPVNPKDFKRKKSAKKEDTTEKPKNKHSEVSTELLK